jgi:hypothetical protein
MSELGDALDARGRWLVEQLRAIGARGEDAVDIDAVEAPFTERPSHLDDAFVRRLWATAARRMGHGRVVANEHLDGFPSSARILLEVEGGKRFWLSYDVEPDPPHRLLRFTTGLAVPAGITIRQAVLPDDGPALAALEREAPIVLPGRSVRFDYDDDNAYFEGWALLDDPGAVVAETDEDGVVASIQLSVVPLRIDDTDYRGGYAHRVRTHPSHAGNGLVQHLSEAGIGAKPVGPGGAMDALVVAIGKGNDAMLKGWAGRPGEWPVGPTRFVIDAVAAAGDAPPLATATPDLADAVRILNAGHANDEGYRPYTIDTLATRLGRAPDLYGPADLVRLGEAVMGIWAVGERVRTIVTTTDEDGTAEEDVQRRAVAADWGVVRGHEEDLARLLRTACDAVARRGLTHLCVYASPATPGWDVLCGLPAVRDEFHLWTLPVQPGAPDRGTYVDAVAF